MDQAQQQAAEDALLRRFLAGGQSMTELAAELDTSKQVVSKRLRSAWPRVFGTPPPRKIINPSHTEAAQDRLSEPLVRQLYADGLSQNEISAALGINAARVSRIIAGCGMQRYRCRMCGADVAPQVRHCDACKDALQQSRRLRTYAAVKAKRQKRFAAGLCVKCGKVNDTTGARCSVCRAKDSIAKSRARQAKPPATSAARNPKE